MIRSVVRTPYQGSWMASMLSGVAFGDCVLMLSRPPFWLVPLENKQVTRLLSTHSGRHSHNGEAAQLERERRFA